MDKIKNNLQKLYDISGYCKKKFNNIYSNRNMFFQKIVANKKIVLIGASIAALILVVGSSSYFLLFNEKGGKEQYAFSLIKKGELVGSTAGFGQNAWLGNLKVTLQQSVEESYRPLELDEFGKRVTKTYFGIDLEVYNTDLNVTDFLVYGLTDDLGNEYERDFEVEFYIDDKKDLGKADNYIPQTLRRGYLFFPPIDEKAKKLELSVYSKVQDKKIVFEIER